MEIFGFILMYRLRRLILYFIFITNEGSVFSLRPGPQTGGGLFITLREKGMSASQLLSIKQPVFAAKRFFLSIYVKMLSRYFIEELLI